MVSATEIQSTTRLLQRITRRHPRYAANMTLASVSAPLKLGSVRPGDKVELGCGCVYEVAADGDTLMDEEGWFCHPFTGKRLLDQQLAQLMATGPLPQWIADETRIPPARAIAQPAAVYRGSAC